MRTVISLLLLIFFATSVVANTRQQQTSDAISLRADSLYNSAMEAYQTKDFGKAVNDCNKALSLNERLHGKVSKKYATTLYALSLLHHMNGDNDAAITAGEKSRDLIADLFGTTSETYTLSLTSLAASYIEAKMYDKAIATQRELTNILGTRSTTTEYIEALNKLGDMYHLSGQYRQAINTRTLSLDKCATLPNNAKLMAGIIGSLATEYFYVGDYENAVKRGREAVNATKRISGEKSPQYISALNNLANFHSGDGNYTEALKIHRQCLSLTAEIHGTGSTQYAGVLSTIAGAHSRLGNNTEAIIANREALDILQHNDKSTILRIYTLSNHVGFLIDLGDYDEAIKYSTEALNVAQNEFGHNHLQTARAMSKHALAKYHSGKINEAIEIETDAVEIFQSTIGTHHELYIVALSSLAAYYSRSNNIDKAIEFATKALNIQVEVNGKENVHYATILSNLAIYLSKKGDYLQATKFDKEAASIYARATSKRHPDYGSIVSNTAVHALSGRDSDSFIKAANEYTHLATEIVSHTFADLTSTERNLFWNKYSNWFTHIMPRGAWQMPSKESISNAYNCTLFAKGLLLNSEIEMRRLLAESGDSHLLGLYDEIQSMRHLLNRLYEKHANEREYPTDSIESQLAEAERRLIAQSKSYGDFTRNLSINWQDVRDRLGDKEIAIEFVSFPSNDSTVYVAYILKKEFKSPQMVTLPHIGDTKDLSIGDIYTGTTLSEKIWGTLSQYLSNTETIYFAPSGALYNIAIESLPHWSEPLTTIAEHWNIYRLSSTRQLAGQHAKRLITNAAVYGGLKYDTDAPTLISNSRQYKPGRQGEKKRSAIANSLCLRNGVDYLPATLTEAQTINRNLADGKIANRLYTDTTGTEASFKALSGQGKNLLHIATHGFYWTEREVRRMSEHAFLRIGNNNLRRYAEDKALSRSGLLLAGANLALTGKSLPEGVDDGVLTAREIAQLDLKGLELVVLSACQTGVGEVTGEGVFGLQRGFKKAGAQAILMSLWKVDDKATAMLMSEFYRHWTTGTSMHQSLELAKKSLRATSQFNSPEFWAAFILLDAFN